MKKDNLQFHLRRLAEKGIPPTEVDLWPAIRTRYQASKASTPGEPTSPETYRRANKMKAISGFARSAAWIVAAVCLIALVSWSIRGLAPQPAVQDPYPLTGKATNQPEVIPPTSPPTSTAPAATGQPSPTEPSAVANATLGNGVLLYEWRDAPERSLLRLVDPKTGVDIPGYSPILLGRSYAYAVSPDRNILAMVVYPSNNNPYGGRLDLIDLQTWQVVTTTVKIDQWNIRMVFSPDNKHLAITTGNNATRGRLVLIDIARQATAAQTEFDFQATHIKFTSDNRALMVYGSVNQDYNKQSPPPAQVLLFNIPDLKVAWNTTLPDVLDGFVPDKDAGDFPGPGEGRWLNPAVVFSPVKDVLYIIHANDNRLTNVDFDTHKVRTVVIHPPMSLLDELMALTAGVAYAKTSDGTFKHAVLSPDGQQLYVIGEDIVSTKNKNTDQWETNRTPLGLKVIRTTDGTELAHIDTQSSDLDISPDGTILYLRSWGSFIDPEVPFTEIWDISHQKLLKRLDNQYLTPSRQLNGQPILLSNSLNHGLIISATFDAKSFTPLHEWASPFYGDWVIFP